MSGGVALAEPGRPEHHRRYRFGFVLEQTLGHVAHGRNVVRAVQADRELDPTVIEIGYDEPRGMGRLPGLRSWSWRASAKARLALRERMRKGRLDAILMHTQVVSLSSVDTMGIVPTVVSLDATPRIFDQVGQPYGHRRNSPAAELIKHRVNSRAFSAAARLVTWCRWAAYSLSADYGVPAEKVDVIPPGVDLEIFRPLLISRRSERPRVLFVGGDFDRKGGPDLLAAAGALGDSIDLDIVTESNRVDVPPGVRATVHRNLKPQSERLVQLYRWADIFVLPSRGDCMPQAVAEALACGLPIIATAVGAIPEMVSDGVNGCLVAPGDPRALAAALRALVNSPAQRHAMARRSHQIAVRDHDAATNNARLLRLMKNLADAYRTRVAESTT